MDVSLDHSRRSKEPDEIRRALGAYTGTTGYKAYMGVLLTDGVCGLADLCDCWWFVDIIASYQGQARKKPELADMQVWKLEVNTNYTGRVLCTDGNDNPPVFETFIEFTDFPLPEGATIWIENGGPDGRQKVLLLPSEH